MSESNREDESLTSEILSLEAQLSQGEGSLPSANDVDHLFEQLGARLRASWQSQGSTSPCQQKCQEETLQVFSLSKRLVLSVLDTVEHQVRETNESKQAALDLAQANQELAQEERREAARLSTRLTVELKELEREKAHLEESLGQQRESLEQVKIESRTWQQLVSQLEGQLERAQFSKQDLEGYVERLKEELVSTGDDVDLLQRDLEHLVAEKEQLCYQVQVMAEDLDLAQRREQFYLKLKSRHSDAMAQLEQAQRENTGLQSQVYQQSVLLQSANRKLSLRDLQIENMERRSQAATSEFEHSPDPRIRTKSVYSSLSQIPERHGPQIKSQPLTVASQSPHSFFASQLVAPQRMRQSTLNPNKLLRSRTLREEEEGLAGPKFMKKKSQRDASEKLGQIQLIKQSKPSHDCLSVPKVAIMSQNEQIEDLLGQEGEADDLAAQLGGLEHDFNCLQRTVIIKTIIESEANPLDSSTFKESKSPVTRGSIMRLGSRDYFSPQRLSPLRGQRPRLSSHQQGVSPPSCRPTTQSIVLNAAEPLCEAVRDQQDPLSFDSKKLQSKMQVVSDLLNRIEGSFAESSQHDLAVRSQLDSNRHKPETSSAFAHTTKVKNSAPPKPGRKAFPEVPLTPGSQAQMQRLATQHETYPSSDDTPATRQIPPLHLQVCFREEPQETHQASLQQQFETTRKSRKARTLASQMLQKVLLSQGRAVMDPSTSMHSIFSNQKLFKRPRSPPGRHNNNQK